MQVRMGFHLHEGKQPETPLKGWTFRFAVGTVPLLKERETRVRCLRRSRWLRDARHDGAKRYKTAACELEQMASRVVPRGRHDGATF